SIEMSFMAASCRSGGGGDGGQPGLQETADVVAGVPVVALALVGAHAEALLDLLSEFGQLGRIHVVGAIEARVHLELGRGQVDIGGQQFADLLSEVAAHGLPLLKWWWKNGEAPSGRGQAQCGDVALRAQALDQRAEELAA